MSRKGLSISTRLLDDYVRALKHGERPDIDEVLAACPEGDREELHLAMLGASDLLSYYWRPYVSSDAIQKAVDGAKRIQEQQQQYQATQERLAALCRRVISDPVECLRAAMGFPASAVPADRGIGASASSVRAFARGEVRSSLRTRRTDRGLMRSLENRMADRAQDLLAEHDVQEAPVNLDALAASLYLVVQDAPLDTIDGCLLAGDDYGAILLNTAVANRQRRRFTLGHEVSHFVLHRRTRVFREKTEELWGIVHEAEENEANTLAAMLLMPPDLLPKELIGGRPTFDQAERLSEIFDVSLAAALRRLVRDSGEACALAVIGDSGVDWWVESDEFDYFVQSKPHPSTVAGRLSRSAGEGSGTDTLPLSAWIYDPPEGADPDLEIVEEARRFPNGTVYSLITVL